MFAHDIALLITVATPVLVVVGLNLYLYVRGERGTLLMPSRDPYPTADLSVPASQEAFPEAALPAADLMPHSASDSPPGEAANDSDERHAA